MVAAVLATARFVALAEEPLAAELAVQPVVELVGQPGHHLHGEPTGALPGRVLRHAGP